MGSGLWLAAHFFVGLRGWAINGLEDSCFFEEEKVVVWINKGNFYSLQRTINHLVNENISLKIV